MSVQWEDSEFEDSPRDDVSSMFSNSPNLGKPLASVPMARALSTDSDDVEDVDGNMASFYGHPVSSAAGAAPRPLGAPGGSSSSARFQDVPVRLVPEMAGLHRREGASAAAAKRAVIRHIQEGSMQQVAMHCQAVLVRGTSGSYFVYHVEITSDYYKQRWVVCKRYSEFHRLRKKILDKLAAHKKRRGCTACARVGRHLKALSFPKRVALFKDPSSLVTKRTSGLEDFIVAVCQYLGGGGGGGHDRGADDDGPEDFTVCAEITATRFLIKEFLQFPIEHECQHVRAIRQLKYVDPRDVQVDTQTCPICLCEWNELDGHQLVLSPCGHFFHAHCINEWYRTRFDCPMCRTIAGEPNGM